VIAEILDKRERLPPRRPRRNKRGVKRKMSPFAVCRKADRPLSPVDIAKAIRILPREVVPPTEAASGSLGRNRPRAAPRREAPA